jgi:hypothetical protein
METLIPFGVAAAASYVALSVNKRKDLPTPIEDDRKMNPIQCSTIYGIEPGMMMGLPNNSSVYYDKPIEKIKIEEDPTEESRSSCCTSNNTKNKLIFCVIAGIILYISSK